MTNTQSLSKLAKRLYKNNSLSKLNPNVSMLTSSPSDFDVSGLNKSQSNNQLIASISLKKLRKSSAESKFLEISNGKILINDRSTIKQSFSQHRKKLFKKLDKIDNSNNKILPDVNTILMPGSYRLPYRVRWSVRLFQKSKQGHLKAEKFRKKIQKKNKTCFLKILSSLFRNKAILPMSSAICKSCRIHTISRSLNLIRTWTKQVSSIRQCIPMNTSPSAEEESLISAKTSPGLSLWKSGKEKPSISGKSSN